MKRRKTKPHSLLENSKATTACSKLDGEGNGGSGDISKRDGRDYDYKYVGSKNRNALVVEPVERGVTESVNLAEQYWQ